MERAELEKLFCAKLYLEITRYKHRIAKKEVDEIIERAYEIGCMVNIYELLVEKSKDWDSDILQCLIVVPYLLRQCYRRWLKWDDSLMEELESCIDDELKCITKIQENMQTACRATA